MYSLRHIIRTSDDLVYELELETIIRKIQEKFVPSMNKEDVDLIIFLDKKGKEFCIASVNKEFVHMSYIEFVEGGFGVNYLPPYSCGEVFDEYEFYNDEVYLSYRALVSNKINEVIN